MVTKSARELRKSVPCIPDAALAEHIGAVLRDTLGDTRRASKTIMRWTGVSDTTARKWLYGSSSPSGAHLIALASNSEAVMLMLLKLTGHDKLMIALELAEIEIQLEDALLSVRKLLGGAYA